MKWRIYHRVTPEPAGGDLPPVRQKQASSGQHAASSHSVKHTSCSMQHGAGMNATCIMGQAVCRRACTQHAGSMQQAVKNAACCIYAKCLVLARCIFHSMHSAFSQHAAHCVLSSRISHCSHPFAGPVRSSAPSRQVAPSSEKCGILHVASSKQQAAKSAA